MLDCQRNWSPTILVDWINVGTLTDLNVDGVERAINGSDVDRRAFRVQGIRELNVNVQPVLEVKIHPLFVVVLNVCDEIL